MSSAKLLTPNVRRFTYTRYFAQPYTSIEVIVAPFDRSPASVHVAHNAAAVTSLVRVDFRFGLSMTDANSGDDASPCIRYE